MRLLPAALPAGLLLTGCASVGTSSPSAAGAPAVSPPAAGAPVASAPFYLEGGWETVSVINGFTGRTEATIVPAGCARRA